MTEQQLRNVLVLVNFIGLAIVAMATLHYLLRSHAALTETLRELLDRLIERLTGGPPGGPPE